MFCGDSLGEEMKLLKNKVIASFAKTSATNTRVENIVTCIYILDFYTECML